MMAKTVWILCHTMEWCIKYLVMIARPPRIDKKTIKNQNQWTYFRHQKKEWIPFRYFRTQIKP